MTEDFFGLFCFEPSFFICKKTLTQRYHALMDAFHPDRFIHKTPLEQDIALQTAIKINEGYALLSSSIKRARYLLALLSKEDLQHTEEHTDYNTLFLTEFMEEQIKLHQAIALNNKPLLIENYQKITEKLDHIYHTFDESLKNKNFDQAKQLIEHATYYERMNEQLKVHIL